VRPTTGSSIVSTTVQDRGSGVWSPQWEGTVFILPRYHTVLLTCWNIYKYWAPASDRKTNCLKCDPWGTHSFIAGRPLRDSFIHCRAQKSRFSGPTPPNHYVPRPKNNRYIVLECCCVVLLCVVCKRGGEVSCYRGRLFNPRQTHRS